MTTPIVAPSPVLAEVPANAKAMVIGKHFSGAWEILVTACYPGVPENECPHGYVHCVRTPDGDWVAKIIVASYIRVVARQRDPERMARIESIKKALCANGYATGSDMIGGRGRTREAAAAAAVAGVAATYFLVKGEDGAAWLAERRATEAERLRVLNAQQAAEAERRLINESREAAAKARAEALEDLAREGLALEGAGLLEGSNALAGLRAIVLRLKGLMPATTEPGDDA